MDGPSAARPAGSLGPRLAGRLTAELINRSPQYMNCVRHYEIDLRGRQTQQELRLQVLLLLFPPA